MHRLHRLFIIIAAAAPHFLAALTTTPPAPPPRPPGAEEVAPAAYTEPYIHPGVMVSKDSVWKGYDNLLHLGNDISLSVSIITPEGMEFPVDEKTIFNNLANNLAASGINVVRAKGLEKPSLPMFSLLILVYPLADGYSAFIEGRLMEAVDLKRLALSKDAIYQAITWEQKNLIVSNARQFDDMLLQTVDQIGKSFTERYAFFAAHEGETDLKPAPQEKIKLRDEGKDGKKKKFENTPIVPFQNNPASDQLKLR